MKLTGKMLLLQVIILLGYFKPKETEDMAKHNDLGKWGEDEAAKFLEKKGYVVFERDWRIGHCDLDIVAMTEDSMHLVFVEVKTRRTNDMEEPVQAVDIRKQKNLASAADKYVKSHSFTQEIRFDIISIVGCPTGEIHIEHIEDAFNPMLIL